MRLILGAIAALALCVGPSYACDYGRPTVGQALLVQAAPTYATPSLARQTVTVERTTAPVLVERSQTVTEQPVYQVPAVAFALRPSFAVQSYGYGTQAVVRQRAFVPSLAVAVHSPALVRQPAVVQQSIVERRGLFGGRVVRSRTVIR